MAVNYEGTLSTYSTERSFHNIVTSKGAVILPSNNIPLK